jgi:hypothetical protein
MGLCQWGWPGYCRALETQLDLAQADGIAVA